jgi:uncharacterized protein (TIGR02145 family)
MSPASGGSGNVSYLWLRTGGAGPATLTSNGAATYAIQAGDVSNSGTYYFNRYAKDATCSNTPWMAAEGTYTLFVVQPVNQPQGSCTFTQPPVVGTFASFNKNYSASTFITLMDERDNNNYTVAKIGGYWVMAQNLNYKKDLHFNANSNQANGVTFTSTANGIPAIGSFWCPGNDHATSSLLASCDAWGALYTWETVMMVDGKWSDESKNASNWAGDPAYSTGSGSGNTNNGGRGTNNRGICPQNWHVPTDGELGDILNAMETGTKNHNTSSNWAGTDAGSRGKAKCTCSTGNCSTDAITFWNQDNIAQDSYGLRVLPAGYRINRGSNFARRGFEAVYWSSSVASSADAWFRYFYDNDDQVSRIYNSRSNAFSVRCVMN